MENHPVNENSRPLIFISHASKDKAIIKLFMDYILKNGLGLSVENIICTSFEETTMHGGEDIPCYIKRNIKDSSVVLSMVSQNYRQSEVCMNEVGAAWALDNTPIQVVLPDVDFDCIGWLVSLNKALKISERDHLDNLCETLCGRLKIKRPTIKNWNGTVTTFLETLPDVCMQTRKDHVYLTFENDSTELDVEVPIVATHYVNDPSGMSEQEKTNGLLWDNPFRAMLEACKPEIVPVPSFSGREKNRSKLPFRFCIHSEREHIENVEVLVQSDEVEFSDSNVSGGLVISALNKRISIESHQYSCYMGSINPEMKHKTKEVFIEFPSLYTECDSFDFAAETTVPFQLNYVISTKSGSHKGTLSLCVRPSYIHRYKEDHSKLGRTTTSAHKEEM